MITASSPAYRIHPLASPVQPTRPQLAVSGAIFRDGKVLLVRRARSPGKGFYSFPGGRVEFGESLHTALHREVDEESWTTSLLLLVCARGTEIVLLACQPTAKCDERPLTAGQSSVK